jgi:hypothetical protein
MTRRVLVGDFGTEDDLLGAARAARDHGFRIADAYTPYAVHGLDRAMGLRPSRLPWVCFGLAVFGAVSKLLFQFWAMSVDWPVNVGGKPWNSFPAYVPVTFEVMVLLAGLGTVLAFLLRCRLLPGKKATLLFPGVTDDSFVLLLERPEDLGREAAAREMLREFRARDVAEREI